MDAQKKAQVYSVAPEGFSPTVSVVGCYLEYGGKLLILRRSKAKSESGRWGVPAGKLQQGESPAQAAARELLEETGIEVKEEALQSLGCLFVRKENIDFTWHMFHFPLPRVPDVRLNGESDSFHWAAAHELETLPLVGGARSSYLRYCLALPGAKKRVTASVSSYLILKREGTVLLGLRQNTGYSDGLWSLPAGHAEEGEPASAAMIREAKEELGIRIAPSELKPVHIMHRQSNRLNVDIFFQSIKWEGEIDNKEPEKCEKLAFFPLDALPENLVGYNRQVLDAQGIFYSEPGWE